MSSRWCACWHVDPSLRPHELRLVAWHSQQHRPGHSQQHRPGHLQQHRQGQRRPIRHSRQRRQRNQPSCSVFHREPCAFQKAACGHGERPWLTASAGGRARRGLGFRSRVCSHRDTWLKQRNIFPSRIFVCDKDPCTRTPNHTREPATRAPGARYKEEIIRFYPN